MRVYIIDDHFVLRKKISKILAEYKPSIFEIVSVENEIRFYKDIDRLVIHPNDIFIIDINLNTYFSGIDLAEKIRIYSKECHIIFLTVYDNWGIDIINRQISADGYLLKDLPHHELVENLFLFIDQVDQHTCKDSQILEFRCKNHNVFVPFSDIIYITICPGFRNTLLIQTTDEQFLIQERLKEIKSKLTETAFILDLKSFIINKDYVKIVSPSEGLIMFTNLTTLSVGKTGAQKVLRHLREGD